MQTENELLATAKKYGVPLPQTCIELEWKEPTNFIWVKEEEGYKLHSKSDYMILYLLASAKFSKSAMIEFKDIEKDIPKTTPNRNANSRLEQGKLSAFTEILTLLGVNTEAIYCQDDIQEIEGIPAPQMHEIAPLLPPFSNSSYQTVFQKTLKNELVYCENVEERLFVSVENHHYAQAYAELFIKLKEKNLLPNANSH